MDYPLCGARISGQHWKSHPLLDQCKCLSGFARLHQPLKPSLQCSFLSRRIYNSSSTHVGYSRVRGIHPPLAGLGLNSPEAQTLIIKRRDRQLTVHFLSPHLLSAPSDSGIGSVSLSVDIPHDWAMAVFSCETLAIPGNNAPLLIFFPSALPYFPFLLTLDALGYLPPNF